MFILFFSTGFQHFLAISLSLSHPSGCEDVMKLSELGQHILQCTHRPTGELDAKVRLKN